MTPSSRVARYAAYVLDILIVGIVNYIVVKAIPSTNTLMSIAGIVYFCLMTYYKGATLGKKFFGLKVVEESGAKVTGKDVVIREVVGKIISGIVFLLGYIWILFDKKRQGWHDKIAHTMVVEVAPLTGGKKAVAYILFILGIILPIIAAAGLVATLLLVSINPSAQLQKARDVEQQNSGGSVNIKLNPDSGMIPIGTPFPSY